MCSRIRQGVLAAVFVDSRASPNQLHWAQQAERGILPCASMPGDTPTVMETAVRRWGCVPSLANQDWVACLILRLRITSTTFHVRNSPFERSSTRHSANPEIVLLIILLIVTLIVVLLLLIILFLVLVAVLVLYLITSHRPPADTLQELRLLFPTLDRQLIELRQVVRVIARHSLAM